mgnify:CR=1 FL=1
MNKIYLLGFALLVASCSTMFNSGSQPMQVVASDGKRHKVNITTPSGSYKANIPSTITASPSTFKNVEVKIPSSDCYYPTSVTVGKTITASFWANIFNYGLGFIIDPLTGAMWNYDSISTLTISEKDCDKNRRAEKS